MHKVILTILYRKKKTMEKIIDSEGGEIKLLKLFPMRIKVGCKSGVVVMNLRG